MNLLNSCKHHHHLPSFTISVFGTVFVSDLANDPAARDIENATLLRASTEYVADEDEVIDRTSWKRVRKFSAIGDYGLSKSESRQFLREIATRSVSPMKEESSILLKRYFVASRRVRQQTMSAKGGAEIHISAMETM